jgi:UDP-N-acetyl-D-mannosaminuronic acid transferase (WecB/TagA/CpsF family)
MTVISFGLYEKKIKTRKPISPRNPHKSMFGRHKESVLSVFRSSNAYLADSMPVVLFLHVPDAFTPQANNIEIFKIFIPLLLHDQYDYLVWLKGHSDKLCEVPSITNLVSHGICLMK